MKAFKKILIAALLVLVACSFIACGDNSSPPDKPNGDDTTTLGLKGGNKTPSDIKTLADLTDYGKKEAHYGKKAVSFNKDAKTYEGKDCSTQVEKLQKRINDKYGDVTSGESDSAFVKIFAMSTPEGILQALADAALSFDEMDRVVTYLYGTVEDPDVSLYLKDDGKDNWSGKFASGAKWLDQAQNGYFNDGWDFFSDVDLYQRLKDYTESLKDGDDKDLAGDNTAWQYRSILKKVYEEVKLDGDAAARTATYMLAYGITVVQGKSGSIDGTIVTSGEGDNLRVTEYKAFAEYCRHNPKNDPGYNPQNPGEQAFDGLADYETLSYLLAFNEYYNGGKGLQACVTVYGYYYDYNKTYYHESLADQDTYEKQLKYEKMSVYTNEEWLDYVSIQRNNYEKAYRYTDDCYRLFYEEHFAFQSIIEKKDALVYDMAAVISDYSAKPTNTTYTREMKKAIQVNGTTDGLKGQLALSDWMWCYSEDKQTMIDYNEANSKYEQAKDKGNAEKEYEGKFDFEMEQLHMSNYLLTKMSAAQLSSALYYNVYAYSASMVGNMTGDIKQIVYIADGIEEGSHYTTISKDAKEAGKENQYAKEKINVIYGQTFESWNKAGVSTLAKNSTNQSWSEMQREIQDAIKYDYENMSNVVQNKGKWEQRCERLEDLVVMRQWSCCGQKVHEADASKCNTGHATKSDGTVATKDYDESHKISLFANDYECVIMHIGGQSKLSFNLPTGGKAYKTDDATTGSWTTGYNGTFEKFLEKVKKAPEFQWGTEKKTITLSSGKSLSSQIENKDLDSEDSAWWENNKSISGNSFECGFDAYTVAENMSGKAINYKYTYKFTGWYLDKNCKYEFSEDDDVNVNLTLYAGYEIVKTQEK